MSTIRRNFEAEFAALTTQVAGIETHYRDLQIVVVGLDKKIEANNLNLDRKIDSAFANLAAKIDARSTTPWVAIWASLSVVLAATGMIGWLALKPHEEQYAHLQTNLTAERQVRGAEDLRIREMLIAIRRDADYTRGYLSATSPNYRP